MSKLSSPILLVYIASVTFSLPPILIKLLINDLSPISILSFRFIFVAITFPLIVVLFRKSSFRDLITIGKTEFKHFFFLSLILVVEMILFFYSFYFIDVNKAVFLFLTSPIITLIMADVFLREKMSLTDIVAVVISFIGVVLMFRSKLNFDFSAYKGEILVIASSLLWSGYIILNRHSGETTNHYRKTLWIFLLNSVIILPVFLMYGDLPSFFVLEPKNLAILFTLSFITLIPFTLLSYTAKHVKSSTSSIILLLGPVISIVLSFFVLKESLPLSIIAGGSLVLVAAFISTYSVEKIFSASKEFANRIKTVLFGY